MNQRSVYSQDRTGIVSEKIARRVSQITVSAIKQMPVLASKLDGCVSLGQGIPSSCTPEFIREAIVDELRNNNLSGKYSLQPGLPALKEEIAADLKRSRKITRAIEPGTEIFVSCGAMEALAAGICTIVERGDEVILPSPTYASHIEQVLFAEGEPVFVPLVEESGWQLDIEAIKNAITSRTKAIVLCSPANPTGVVYSQQDLLQVAKIAIERKLFVISDEAYDFLTYDDVPFFSLASVAELQEQLICIGSFSRRYCMTGYRVGYMYASSQIIDQVLKVHDAFAICAPTLSQYAALHALRGTNGKDGPGDYFISELHADLAKRRDLVCGRLDKLTHLFSYNKPQGAYYIFPRLALQGVSSVEFSMRLLYEARVITIPGSAFGPTGEGHIRISFGGTEEELGEAFDRIDRWNFQALKG